MKRLTTTFIIFTLALTLSVSAFEYEITYYGKGIPGTGTTTPIASFGSLDSDNIELYLNSQGAFNGTGTYNTNFYSPLNTIYAMATGSIISNNSCLDLGIANKNYTSTTLVEDQVTLVHSATFGQTFGNARYVMTTTERFPKISNTELDSESKRANTYALQACDLGGGGGASVVANLFWSETFGDCINNSVFKVNNTFVSPGSCGVGGPEGFYYVLFNSKEGNLTYSSTFSGTVSAATNHFIYKFEDKSSLDVICNNIGSCSGQIDLEKDTLYVYSVNGIYPTGATRATPIINLTLDIGTPNYVCEEDNTISCDSCPFGDCNEDTNTQQKTCIDSNGLQPNLIVTQSCALTIIENATLGFEEFFTTNDVLICEPQWFFNCFYNIANITVDRPLGWSIVDPAYGGANFLRMTQEYATQGTRSLKMWQIPPKTGEVVDSVTCGNLTTSIIPQIFQGVSNTTFSVSHNVTFPSDNMQITFDVKKCNSQALQHTALVDQGLLFNVTLCNQRCYANDCGEEPNGNYIFNIQDVTNGTSIFGSPQYLEAIDITDSPLFTLSDLGIVPGLTYNVVFAISNENPNDATGNCFYVDNVRYFVTEQPLSELVPGCESRCIGSTRVEATQTQSGSCFTITREFSPLCLDSEDAELVENQDDFCSDTNTLQSFNEKTGKYEAIDCAETNKVCSDGRCQTEEEVALEDPTQPTEGTEDFLNWFNWIFSPLFIFLIITFILATLISVATSGKSGVGSFETFGAVIIIMMIVGTLPGIAIIPIWVAVAIIVIVALMIAKTLGVFSGSGGG